LTVASVMNREGEGVVRKNHQAKQTQEKKKDWKEKGNAVKEKTSNLTQYRWPFRI